MTPSEGSSNSRFSSSSEANFPLPPSSETGLDVCCLYPNLAQAKSDIDLRTTYPNLAKARAENMALFSVYTVSVLSPELETQAVENSKVQTRLDSQSGRENLSANLEHLVLTPATSTTKETTITTPPPSSFKKRRSVVSLRPPPDLEGRRVTTYTCKDHQELKFRRITGPWRSVEDHLQTHTFHLERQDNLENVRGFTVRLPDDFTKAPRKIRTWECALCDTGKRFRQLGSGKAGQAGKGLKSLEAHVEKMHSDWADAGDWQVLAVEMIPEWREGY